MTDILIFIAVLALIAIATGVLFVWQQLKVTRRSMVDDGERLRRQSSLEITREWNRSIGPEVGAARKLIEKLDAEQCQRITNLQTLEIEAQHESLVEACLGSAATREKSHGVISLDAAAVNKLRYFGVNFLNELEIVLSAWNEGVGNRRYLENEFNFVNYDLTLPLFRRALGSSVYPAIEAFTKREATESDEEPLRRLRR